jgi:hypothetical protein
MIQVISVPLLIDIGKWVSGFSAVLWAGFRAFTWVKQIREKDLAELKQNVGNVQVSVDGVKAAIEHQTNRIVSELQEQRQDFRTFYAPLLTTAMVPMQMQQARRAKKAPVKRKK